MKRPGGELSSRPLYFFWLCDTSGSMSLNGKIESLNDAIRKALPAMQKVADDNPYANVLVRPMRFSHGAKWQIPEVVPLRKFEWQDMPADPMDKPSVDIVFMIDTSGSMSNEIEAVKRSCLDFADRIIERGAEVRMGLVGFDIGGYWKQVPKEKNFTVHNLSVYTIGVWPLGTPQEFKQKVSPLQIGLFGGGGCYLANADTVDIFPHVVKIFGTTPSGSSQNSKILVVISDEIGNASGLDKIVEYLQPEGIKTYVLGVPGSSGAHENLASRTGGKFWDISKLHAVADFSELLENVAGTIAREVTKKMVDGSTSAGTDMGAALRLIAKQLTIPPMEERALPPVIVLISDGRPTDDFEDSLKAMMQLPWARKAVRIAIAVGQDADPTVLEKFIGNPELKPLQANNPEALVHYIRWASTAVLQNASAPPNIPQSDTPSPNTQLPVPTLPDPSADGDVW